MKLTTAVPSAIAVLALIGCQSPQPTRTQVDIDPEPAAPQDAVHLLHSGFALAWMRPDVSFASYDAVEIIYPMPVYRTPPRHSSAAESGARNYAFSDDFTSDFMSALEESFAHQMTSARGWRPESAMAERTLRIRVALVNLVVNAPLTRLGDETRTWMDSVGEVTVVIDCLDGQETIARFGERRFIQTPTRRPIQATPGPVLYESRQIFQQWAQKLRRVLERLEQRSAGEESPQATW